MKVNFLKFRTQSLLKRNKTSRTSIPYKEATSIGIVFSIEDKTKHDSIKEFIKRLEADGKKVKVIAFLPKKKENYEFMFDFFTEDDLSFFGKNNSTQAVKFVATPFDILYYVDATPNSFILNLIAASKAKFRIGKFWAEGQPYFELMIESVGETNVLMDEMYKYSSVLR